MKNKHIPKTPEGLEMLIQRYLDIMELKKLHPNLNNRELSEMAGYYENALSNARMCLRKLGMLDGDRLILTPK